MSSPTVTTTASASTPPRPPESEATPLMGLLRSPRAVLFGAGQRRALGTQAAQHGRHALVCTDRRLVASAEFAAMLTDLQDHGLEVNVWSETEAELPTRDIEACHAAMTGLAIDVVVGIGGGSCLDMAKAVAVLITHGGPIDRYYGEEAIPGPVLPIIAVPTTGGTGSEVTPVCVLSDDRRELKTGISSVHLIPVVAICDPELTLSCPAGLTASAGADALTHLVESFTAVRRPSSALSEKRVFVGKNVISDSYTRWGLPLLAASLPVVLAEPGNLRARSEVMLAANAGGFALGVAGTAAAHALQYPLGALTHSAHGVGVGVLLPYVMRFNASTRIPELAEIGRLLGRFADTEQALALAGIEAVEQLLGAIGIPRTLAELGLAEGQLPYVATMGLKSTRLVDNNPRLLDHDAMLEITTAAFFGDRRSPW